MTEPNTDYVLIKYHADQLSGAAICAYWDNERLDMHKSEIIARLESIKELVEKLK